LSYFVDKFGENGKAVKPDAKRQSAINGYVNQYLNSGLGFASPVQKPGMGKGMDHPHVGILRRRTCYTGCDQLHFSCLHVQSVFYASREIIDDESYGMQGQSIGYRTGKDPIQAFNGMAQGIRSCGSGHRLWKRYPTMTKQNRSTFHMRPIIL
jgi:hypothetical protein